MILNRILPCVNTTFVRGISSATAGITRVHRLTYARRYPTLLVRPDGSSVRIRYFEPRAIITLPLDLNTLSEEEKRIRLDKRRPKQKMEVIDETKIKFDAKKYVKLLKRK